MFFGLGMAAPQIRDADAAREPDASIDDEKFAMGAVVDAGEIIPMKRVVSLDLDACGFEFIEHGLLDFPTADPIENDMHVHPRPSTLTERGRELAADFSGPIDEGLEGDGLTSAANGGKHGGENLVAVLEGRDAVARQDSRTEDESHGAQKLRVFDREAMVEGDADVLLARLKIEK